MDMARVLPIVVQFGLGAGLCWLGVWGALRGGYLDPHLPADRRLIALIIGGYLALLLISVLFTFWLPFLGEGATP